MHSQKGIVLITTLMVVFFLVMLSTVLVISSSQSLTLTSYFHDRELALHAAQTGADYARRCIERSIYWDGADTGGNISYGGVTTTELVDGKKVVIGDLGNGEKFYICFEKASNYNKFVSVNNLSNTSSTSSKILDTGGNDSDYRTVPKGMADIIVKGVYGNMVKYVEVMYAVQGPNSLDTVAFASNTMEVDLSTNGAKWNVSSESPTLPIIRSNYTNADYPGVSDPGNVSIKSSSSTAGSGYVNLNEGYAMASGNISLPADANGKIYPGEPKYNAPDLTMDRVNAALPQPEGNIDGGTYVFNGDGTVSYYTDYYESAPNIPPVRTYSQADFNQKSQGIQMTDSTSLLVSSTVQVNPAASGTGGAPVAGVSFLSTASNGMGGTKALTITMQQSNGGNVPYIKNNNDNGNIYVKGELTGTGTVVAGGNVTFEGRSALDATPQVGISMYAKGNITINAVSDTSSLPLASQSGVSSELLSLYNNYAQNNPVKGGAVAKNFAKFVKKQVRGDQSGDSGDYEVGGSGAGSSYPALSKMGDKQVKALAKIYATKTQPINPKDTVFYGLIYTTKNFNANMNGYTLSINGGLIVNGALGEGKISIRNADGVVFNYDPSYLNLLKTIDNSCTVRRIFWAAFNS
ncbi:MAG: hypothetical protein M1536_07820 [Firmicutes bacterium]|nr:hypothetical protein [Bacillota bacterium]